MRQTRRKTDAKEVPNFLVIVAVLVSALASLTIIYLSIVGLAYIALSSGNC